ncbi:MAG: ATP-binding protein [Burkholderiales bacterium]
MTVLTLARLTGPVSRLSQRYWGFVVVAMLALLHVAAVRGVTDVWARGLLLAHLGLFLIWQPFVRGQYQVSTGQFALIIIAAAGVMLRLDWWLLAFWVVVLAGLIAGKVYQQNARWQRRFHLLVLFYLLALLAVVILPEIAPRQEISDELRLGAQYGLPVILLVAALLPTEPEAPDAPQVIDFFYSVFVMLLLGIVILGSFTIMTLGRTPYLQALTYTVFAIAATVLVLGLAWDPHAGYAGLNVFFSRYLFSIGLPVEKWLYFLAELSHLETRPERFLAESVAALMRLQWIAGVEWRGAHGHGAAGVKTEHRVEFENSELALTLHSRYRTSPALYWHLNLLGQLLGEFYLAKLREQKLKQQSYLEAVHETGARMTHDVKNLLQSLNALCAVAEREPEGESQELQALIRRQLPVIARRLGDTLERLQQPHPQTEPLTPADEWWESLALQYRDKRVEFAAEGLRPGVRIPRGLFDSVADNLLHNALAKREAESGVRIRVTLTCGDRVVLSVCDTGQAVRPDLVPTLLRAPVVSGAGLGIGLYQAARQAEASGYLLELKENRDGEVCFALSGETRSR